MTRKEAIDILERTRPYINMCYGASEEKIEEAMIMAIKALEQEPALDKIRTDIKAMFPPSGSWTHEEWHEVEHAVCEVSHDVLQIIDMYKEDEVMNKEQKDKLIKMLAEDKNDFIVGCNRRIAEEYGKIEGADYMLQIIMDALCEKEE